MTLPVSEWNFWFRSEILAGVRHAQCWYPRGILEHFLKSCLIFFFFLVTLHYLFKEKLLSANINSFFEETSVVAKVIYLFVHYSVVCALLKCVKIWKRRYFVNLLNLVILLKNRIITEYFVCIYGVLSLLCCKYICYGFLPFVCIFIFGTLHLWVKNYELQGPATTSQSQFNSFPLCFQSLC